MTLLLSCCAVMLWLGAALLIGELRWARRPRLHQRLAPYLPGGAGGSSRDGDDLFAILRVLAVPVAASGWRAASRMLGVNEELARRLERVHASQTVGEWRLRQFGWSLAGFVGSLALVAALRPVAPIAGLAVIGAPALAFLIIEQRLLAAGTRWQRQVFLELPVVSEQLGMLLSAGYSVTAGIDRLADRSQGSVATDLRRVGNRMRHGLSEHDALREWADISGVPAVARLVAVLALDREAGDLGRLITTEARAVRREAYRELVETIERRAQQVWVPVTVATLLPGVLFLAVPFVAAMQLFTSS